MHRWALLTKIMHSLHTLCTHGIIATLVTTPLASGRNRMYLSQLMVFCVIDETPTPHKDWQFSDWDGGYYYSHFELGDVPILIKFMTSQIGPRLYEKYVRKHSQSNSTESVREAFRYSQVNNG